MGGSSPPPAPEKPDPEPLPDPDTESKGREQSAERKAAKRRRQSGRASTIITQGNDGSGNALGSGGNRETMG